jgi:hypothetical protein
VVFEGGDVAEDDALVDEEGARPLDLLDDTGGGGMDELAEVVEDGLGEGG